MKLDVLEHWVLELGLEGMGLTNTMLGAQWAALKPRAQTEAALPQQALAAGLIAMSSWQ